MKIKLILVVEEEDRTILYLPENLGEKKVVTVLYSNAKLDQWLKERV